MDDVSFDAVAQQYDRELGKGLSITGEDKLYYAAARIEHLVQSLPGSGAQSFERVLDYGCGTGSALPLLRRAFPQAVIAGTDVSAASLEIARRENPDATLLGPEGLGVVEPFDVCHCNGVFHHIPPDERLENLRLIHRSLRPKGWLAFFENNPWNPGTRMVMKRIPFDRDAITLPPPESIQRLRSAGFEVVKTDYLFFFPKSLAALRVLEPKLSRVPLGGQYLVLAQKS